MTWNVLQSVGVVGSGSSTVATYTSNVSAGTKLIAYFSAFGSGSFTITSVKDAAGNTMTQVGFLYSATSGTGTGIFAMDTPAGDVGTKPVITALMSNSQFGGMVIQEVSGLAVGNTLAAMIDGTTVITGFAAGASHAQPAYTSSAAGEFLVSYCGDQGGPQIMTQPAGYTLSPAAINNNSSVDCCPSYKTSAGGSESGTWGYTGSTVGSNIMVVAFLLAPAGPAPGPAPVPVAIPPGRHSPMAWQSIAPIPNLTPALVPPPSPLTVIQAAAPVHLTSLTGPVNVTLPQPTYAGASTLVACVGTNGTVTANPHVISITLGGSADHWGSVVVLTSATRNDAEIWSDPGCAAGQTAVAVTFGGGGGTGDLWVTVYEVAGVLTADQVKTAEGAGTAWSSGASPTTTQANEIFSATGMFAGSQTPAVTGAGTWTAQSSPVSAALVQTSGYQNVSATGTATFSGTIGTSANWTVAEATFYIAGAAPAVIPDVAMAPMTGA